MQLSASYLIFHEITCTLDMFYMNEILANLDKEYNEIL